MRADWLSSGSTKKVRAVFFTLFIRTRLDNGIILYCIYLITNQHQQQLNFSETNKAAFLILSKSNYFRML
jgi:hypothetical protein